MDDLTRENSLLITDFADDDEVEDAKDLWEAQVTKLRRVLGC
ncbi:MAG: START-like domain-containing protein [Bacteroidota bacterium]|nr:START-like domain-containing protein [Bacteroidota bacterium]